MIRLPQAAIDTVSRVPARVQTKLLVAFLAMVTLIVLLGGVGLHILSGINRQTEALIGLQRKIAAYRHVQHDTTRQLYAVASALLSGDERDLDAVLRQLRQFGYDLDRLEYVIEDEAEVLAEVRAEYGRFIETVTEAVERARVGDLDTARTLQVQKARPLADHLERLSNQLVNIAEANMHDRIDASQRAYEASQTVVFGLALGSIVLALGLGYVFSWSIVGPLMQIEGQLHRVASGEFSGRVRIVNRDELGTLAANLNRTCDELALTYGQLERSISNLETLGKVSREISSTLDVQTVLRTIATHVVALAKGDAGAFFAYESDTCVFRLQVTHELDPGVVDAIRQRPIHLGEGATGRAGLQRAAVQIADIDNETSYEFHELIGKPGYRALLAVPLLREERLVGALVICRKTPGPFAGETVHLVQTLANQSALAIQNAELFEELQRKSEELAAASQHKSEFLANMSHELRTPLNAVLGYAELIQDGIYGELPDHVEEVLERIQQNGRHLLGLINDVLDLSKVEAGQLTLSPGDYSMRTLVLEVVGATEALATEKGLALLADLPEDLPRGRGDERRITQVLMNLVSNAIKFTELGTVTIRARAEDGHYVVAVSDTGVGIAAEEHGRIFEEFQQVDSSSTREKGGTGLGLAIAKRIVELHGGRIWVESTEQQGATFSFTLPLGADRQVDAA